MNLDGNLDLVLFGDDVTVYPGQGDGRFGPPIITKAGAIDGTGVLGDFDGDGKLDAVEVGLDNTFGTAALLLIGNGDGTFQSPVAYPFSAFVLAAGDLNQDGALDIIGGADGCVSILLNAGAK